MLTGLSLSTLLVDSTMQSKSQCVTEHPVSNPKRCHKAIMVRTGEHIVILNCCISTHIYI
jgi:hypothetical protein